MTTTRSPAEAVKAAAALLGSQRALALALDLQPPTVNEWATGDKPVPSAQAPYIELLTGRAVTCEELCPKVPWGIVRNSMGDVVREYLDAHRQLETAHAHAEGEATPMEPGPKLAATVAAAKRYAAAYQALAKLAEPRTPEEASADIAREADAVGARMLALTYNRPGHVCPDTGRLCMTVSDAYAREDFPDRHFWLYDTRDAENGMDPWRQVDGIDASTSNRSDGRPSHYSVDFANMRMVNVQPSYTVYMQRTKAEREGAQGAQPA